MTLVLNVKNKSYNNVLECAYLSQLEHMVILLILLIVLPLEFLVNKYFPLPKTWPFPFILNT